MSQQPMSQLPTQTVAVLSLPCPCTLMLTNSKRVGSVASFKIAPPEDGLFRNICDNNHTDYVTNKVDQVSSGRKQIGRKSPREPLIPPVETSNLWLECSWKATKSQY